MFISKLPFLFSPLYGHSILGSTVTYPLPFRTHPPLGNQQAKEVELLR